MRYYFCLLLSSLLVVAGNAQSKAMSASEIVQYSDQLPSVAASPEQAYDMYFPKGKQSVSQQYDAELQRQMNMLADRSSHKSRLLSMLAGRYDRESEQYDFGRVAVSMDKDLDKKAQEADKKFFGELDNYLRQVSPLLDSIRALNLNNMERLKLELQTYRTYIPVFANKVKQQLREMVNFLDTKKYTIPAADQPSFAYYIQLLEIRGIMLDRLRKLTELIEGANSAAATTVSYCRQNPDDCK